MNDTILRCATCHKTQEVNFATCLVNGWPKCCGYTMRLEKYPDIYTETNQAFKRFYSAKDVIAKLAEGEE
jgi:hypothetical protein